jgi:hypothetical protein
MASKAAFLPPSWLTSCTGITTEVLTADISTHKRHSARDGISAAKTTALFGAGKPSSINTAKNLCKNRLGQGIRHGMQPNLPLTIAPGKVFVSDMLLHCSYTSLCILYMATLAQSRSTHAPCK